MERGRLLRAAYVALQCTWGAAQTILGLCVFALCSKAARWRYHGAIVTQWRAKSSMSLGLFVFVCAGADFAGPLRGQMRKEELARRLLVHEYGHTIQSLILGPVYLLAVGVPSTLWGFLPCLRRRRREQGASYFSFFPERWANQLGERVTGEVSMEMLKIE